RRAVVHAVWAIQMLRLVGSWNICTPPRATWGAVRTVSVMPKVRLPRWPLTARAKAATGSEALVPMSGEYPNSAPGLTLVVAVAQIPWTFIDVNRAGRITSGPTAFLGPSAAMAT